MDSIDVQKEARCSIASTETKFRSSKKKTFIRTFTCLHSMFQSRPFLFCVVIALLSAVAMARIGNCSVPLEDSLYLRSPNGATVLRSFGTYGYLYAAVDGVVYPESFEILINFTGLAERNKTQVDRRCSTPTGLGTTPFDTQAGRGLAAPILNWFSVDEFDCYLYLQTHIINETEIEGLHVRYTRDDFPDWNAIFSYEFTDKDVIVIPSNDTTFTHGDIFSYYWRYVSIFSIEYFFFFPSRKSRFCQHLLHRCLTKSQ
jgi:hypothetical protein